MQPRLLHAFVWIAVVAAMCAPALGQEAPDGLTLDDAIDTALANNPSVVVAHRVVDIAEAAIKLAKLPDNIYFALFANADYQGPLTTLEFPDPNDPSQTTEYTLGSPLTSSAGASFSQPLLAGRQVREGRRGAEAGAMAAAYDADQTLLSIVFGVKRAYYGTLMALEMRDVSAQAVDRALDHLRIAEARFEIGDAAQLEVMQAQVDLANREHDLVSAEGAVAVAIGRLNAAMGIEVTRQTGVRSPGDHDLPVFEYAPMYELAQAARPEIPALQQRSKQLEHEIRRIGTLDDPTLDFTGRYNYSIGSPFTQGHTFGAGLGLTIPLYDKGAEKAQRLQVEAQLAQLQAQEPVLLQQIAQQVHQAVTELGTAGRQIDAVDRALETAQEAFRVAQLAYEGGVGSRIDAKDAQLGLTIAEANRVNALYGYRLALAQVESATGVRALGLNDREEAGEQ